MKYKGRADKLKIGRLVVDFKILGGSLDSACKRFGYHEQLSGYCLPTGCPKALIAAYNKKAQKIETKMITPDEAFWQYQVMRFGIPL